MNFSTIRYSTTEKTGIIALNRPERMNAVIEEMYQEIQEALNEISQDTAIRSVIITGSSFIKNGKKKEAFCAGADLKKHSTGERTPEQKKKYIELAHETCRMIYEFPKPVTAVINGPARGAGAEMALSCDFILMAEEATIAFPETGLGTCVGGGVTRHLAAITGIAKAKYLIYTGEVLSGSDAFSAGIVLETAPVETLMEKALVFSEKMAEKAPVSIRLVKQLIQEAHPPAPEEVLKRETDAILSCMETEDWHEGILAFNEKRKPDYKGR